jgi:hypothetical protein
MAVESIHRANQVRSSSRDCSPQRSQQGQLLIQIKAQLKHGQWLPWVKKNLNIDRVNANLRMKIGALPALPKSNDSVTFDLARLAEVADIAVPCASAVSCHSCKSMRCYNFSIASATLSS